MREHINGCRLRLSFAPPQVLATSRTDYRDVASRMGVTFFTDANDFCEEHPEVVIFASSIMSMQSVVAALPVQRLKRNTLFVDVLSVKEFPKRLMLSTLPPEVRCIWRPCQGMPTCQGRWYINL